VKGTMHWVSAEHAVTAEARLYGHLFNRPDPGADGDFLGDIEADSVEVLQNCRLEPALADAPAGETVQFERLGYFCADPESTADAPVFNRTLPLRDSWAKAKKKA